MTNLEKPKMAIWKKILIGFVVVVILGAIFSKDDKNSIDSKTSEQTVSGDKNEVPTLPTIGQTIKADYFQVTLHNAEITDLISTGNEFTEQKAESGNLYLVLDLSFKNIDKESRMLMDGSLIVNYNGQEYNFDKSESIMAEGYGLFLDQLNPLITKRTKLIYKIPKELKGSAYYMPARNSEDAKFFIGNINMQPDSTKK